MSVCVVAQQQLTARMHAAFVYIVRPGEDKDTTPFDTYVPGQ